MNARCLLFCLIPLFLTCSPKKDLPPTGSFATLLQSFKQPDHKFASAPLWVWNADVNQEMISSQLNDLKAQGFGGVFIHPRAGLITPYLSQQWFDLCAYTLAEAKKLNMDVWIYDENSYPSGFAGGHVPDAMPQSFNQGQMLELVKSSVVSASDTSFLVLKKDGERFVDVTNNPTDKEKKGEYYLFKKTFYGTSEWYGGFSYVDLMVKGVTEKFIEQTMTGYEKIFGPEFGKSVPGIFSDEPNIETQRAHNIRWTPDLFEVFQSKWGYQLEPNLPMLFEETGDWKKVRHNYYQTLLQLFIDRWSKPYYEYTNSKNLEWTGHYWEHEWPSPNVVPDNMAMYAWHQRPAIDMLFNQFDEQSPHAQFGNIRSVKELSSIANQLDKKRTLSETYGGAGWELKLQDLKRLGDWEFVLGVNTLNQHLAHMTIMGARKYDYPQSFSYHNPWFAYYKGLNDYFTRLTLALTAGSQVNNVLVVEPTTTAWMYYNRDNSNPRFNEIGNQFQQFVTHLEQSQVEYDLGCENVIKDHGSVVDGKLMIGSRSYEKVILPPGLGNLDQPTLELLNKFIAAKGEVIRLVDVETIDGTADGRAKEFNGSVPMSFSDNLSLADPDFNLANVGSGDLYHHRRRLPEGDVLFLSNASMKERTSGRIETTATDMLAMDLFSGEVYHYPSDTLRTWRQAEFSIPPGGSMLLFLASSKQNGYKEYPSISRVGTELPAATEVKRLDDNILTVDFCDIFFAQAKLKDQHVYDATDTLFKAHGFIDGNPWNTSVQFKDRTLARDTFKVGTGFKVDYTFTINGKVDLATIKVVVERPDGYRLLINDKPVQPEKGKWWLDKSFGVVQAGTYLHTGANKLTLQADKMSVHSEIEPIYVLGNFSVKPAAKGWSIEPPSGLKAGSWKSQGLPLYSQKVGYGKRINLQLTADKHYWVELGKWEGTVAEVRVNGKSVGTIAYPPYIFDLDNTLQNGDNEIEIVVVGSLKNTLGPFHNKPKPGLVSPWHFRFVKGYPSGSEYDVYDYGLLEDFKVMAN